MDPAALRKEFARLRKETVTAYAVMIALLGRLPVPMTLPPWDGKGNAPARSLNRAWELAGWEPLEAKATGRVRDMITAWLTAYEVTHVTEAFGPLPWRLRAIEASLLTCESRAHQVSRHLDWLADPNGRKP